MEKIKDAHDVLMDMHSPPRPKDAKELAKELLAQVQHTYKIYKILYLSLHYISTCTCVLL